jgi:all-trans-retinol dehydrogenase (NAD+)
VHGKSLLDASDKGIEKTFQVNAVAHCWLLRAFLPSMIRRDKGMVVTLSSASGLIGVAKLGDYAASKWAAYGLAESLRMELKRMGSRVSTLVVAPYYINTGMFDGVKTRFPLILPILEPEYVVDSILQAMRRGDESLSLPRIVGLVPLMRGLFPTSLFDRVTFFLGINDTMDEFKGRQAGPHAATASTSTANTA